MSLLTPCKTPVIYPWIVSKAPIKKWCQKNCPVNPYKLSVNIEQISFSRGLTQTTVNKDKAIIDLFKWSDQNNHVSMEIELCMNTSNNKKFYRL